MIQNLGLQRYSAGDDGQGEGCVLCIPRYIRQNPVVVNTKTQSTENLGQLNGGSLPKNGKMCGEWPDLTRREGLRSESCPQGKSSWPVPGSKDDYIADDRGTRQVLRDAAARDFRPRPDAPAAAQRAGPYGSAARRSRGEDSGKWIYYWIPGRYAEVASNPVPAMGATAKPTTDLMFLPALGCDKASHDLSLGTQEASLEKLGRLEPRANVWFLRLGTLLPGRTYFWRADCVGGPRGKTWRFQTATAGTATAWKREEAEHSKMRPAEGSRWRRWCSAGDASCGSNGVAAGVAGDCGCLCGEGWKGSSCSEKDSSGGGGGRRRSSSGGEGRRRSSSGGGGGAESSRRR